MYKLNLLHNNTHYTTICLMYILHILYITTHSALNTLYIVQYYTYCTVYNVQRTNSVQCTYCKTHTNGQGELYHCVCVILFGDLFFKSKGKTLAAKGGGTNLIPKPTSSNSSSVLQRTESTSPSSTGPWRGTPDPAPRASRKSSDTK